MVSRQNPKYLGLALSLSLLAASAYWPGPALMPGALAFGLGLGAVKNKVLHPFGGGADKGAAETPAADANAAGTDKEAPAADKDAAATDKQTPATDKQAPAADKDNPEQDAADKQPPEKAPAAKQERTQEIETPDMVEDQPKLKPSIPAPANPAPADPVSLDVAPVKKARPAPVQKKQPEEVQSDKEDAEKPAVPDADDPTLGKDIARTKRRTIPENDSPEKLEADVSHPKTQAKKYYDDEGAEMDESDYLDEQERKRKAQQLKEMIAPAGRPEDNDPEIFLNKAKALTKKGQFKPALIEVNTALKLKPQYWEAHYQGALILQTMGRSKEAMTEYKYLVDVRPDYLEAHINLGVLLTGAGEYGAAEKEDKKALELNFYSLSAHYNLANVYIKQERLNEAQKELMICLKLKPTNAWVHNNLGVIYQKRHYLEEAEEEFQKALRLEPANKSFESNLYLVREQMKKKPPVRAGAPVPSEES